MGDFSVRDSANMKVLSALCCVFKGYFQSIFPSNPAKVAIHSDYTSSIWEECCFRVSEQRASLNWIGKGMLVEYLHINLLLSSVSANYYKVQ